MGPAEPIGRTRCGRCGGTGRTQEETLCPTCGGTGLVEVFSEPVVPSAVSCGPSKQRRFTRYYTDLPLTLRDQQGRELAGRCVVIGEGGLAAVLELTAVLPDLIPVGTAVTLRLPIPTHPTVLEVCAVVRNQMGLRHGFEFVSAADSERAAIRQFCAGLMVQSEPSIAS